MLHEVSGESTAAATYSMTTAGRHNVGLRFGLDSGIWWNGTRILNNGVSALADATIGFGSKAVSNGSGGYTPGLALYENLNYMRAWTRTQAYDEENGGCSGPVVSIRTFDRPQPTVFEDVCLDDNTPVMLDTKTQAGDSTQMIVHNADGDVMRTYLPNGRRQTALVIEDAADAWHWNGGNNPGRVAIEGDPLPGVARHVNFDATGTPTAHLRAPEDEDTPDTYGSDAEELPDGGLTEFICITAEHGRHTTVPPALPGAPSADPEGPPTYYGENPGADAVGPETISDYGEVECACRNNDPSEPMEEAFVDVSSGDFTNLCVGVQVDRSKDVVHGVNEVKNKEGKVIEVWFDRRTSSGLTFRYKLKSLEKRTDADAAVKDAKGSITYPYYDTRDANLEWEGVVVYDKLMTVGCVAGKAMTKDDIIDTYQSLFDVVGFLPLVGEFFDAASAALEEFKDEKDRVSQLLSLVSLVPLAGDLVAKPIKAAWKAGKGVNWTKFFNAVEELLGTANCVDGALRQKIQEGMDWLRKFLKEKGVNLDEIVRWCFPGDTMVQTEDGEKEIEDIEVGDRVWAYNEATGRWVLAPVTRVFRRLLVGTLMVLAFAWGELEVTPEHPFYVVHGQGLEAREAPGLRASRTAPGVWVKAGDLRAGDVIHSRTGPAPLLEVRERAACEWVYNLEVRGPHTYTVGAAGLVAHNQCPPRNAHLAGGKHPVTGVPFDKNGFPDFSALSKKTVSIKQTGNRAVDEAAANKAAGYAKTPEGHTWHHHQDKQTMQLVPTDIHAKTGHSGGVAAINSGN